MKIAITSDLHLKTGDAQAIETLSHAYVQNALSQTPVKTPLQNPERFNALKNILGQLLEENIKDLIIAGDLFDIDSQNYSVFDELCREQKYSNIRFFIIPGNHDPVLSQKYFTSKNIMVFNEPGVLNFDDSKIKFFFIPYIHGKSIGEMVAAYKDAVSGKSGNLSGTWLLIGHGDYLSGTKEPNIYEKGIYMPLSRTDIEYYKPAAVVLGHIHKKMKIGKVYYPGSPCGMDINETGKRSFIVMDLNDLSITEKTVDTEIIFFNENLVVIPAHDEAGYIKDKIDELIKRLNIAAEDIPKVRLRLRVSGYTSDKNRLEKVIKEALLPFTFYDEGDPDLSNVYLFNDPERINIVERVKQKIESLDAPGGGAGFSKVKKDTILEQALHTILRE